MDLPTKLSIYLSTKVCDTALPIYHSANRLDNEGSLLRPDVEESTYQSIDQYISINLLIYPPRKIPKYLLIYEFPHLSIYRPINLSIYQPPHINLPSSQSIHLSFFPPIRLSIYINIHAYQPMYEFIYLSINLPA